MYLPLEHGQDRIQHRSSFGENFLIPEPQNRVAVAIQPSGPRRVSWRIRMLATVYFDNQRFLATDKVCKERTKRHLPHELVAIEVPPSQFAPKSVFGFGLINPQFSSSGRCAHFSFGQACRRPLTRPPLRFGHPLRVGERRKVVPLSPHSCAPPSTHRARARRSPGIPASRGCRAAACGATSIR